MAMSAPTILVNGPRHGRQERVARWPLRLTNETLTLEDGQTIPWPPGCYRVDEDDARFAWWVPDNPSGMLGQMHAHQQAAA